MNIKPDGWLDILLTSLSVTMIATAAVAVLFGFIYAVIISESVWPIGLVVFIGIVGVSILYLEWRS